MVNGSYTENDKDSSDYRMSNGREGHHRLDVCDKRKLRQEETH